MQEAEHVASQVRAELGLAPTDPLEPRELAESLGIELLPLSAVREGRELSDKLTDIQSITLFQGPHRVIVFNDTEVSQRLRSSLAHERAHALLQHTPSAPKDVAGGRQLWADDSEIAADRCAAALLVPREGVAALARRGETVTRIADHYGVSERLIRAITGQYGAQPAAPQAVVKSKKRT